MCVALGGNKHKHIGAGTQEQSYRCSAGFPPTFCHCFSCLTSVQCFPESRTLSLQQQTLRLSVWCVTLLECSMHPYRVFFRPLSGFFLLKVEGMQCMWWNLQPRQELWTCNCLVTARELPSSGYPLGPQPLPSAMIIEVIPLMVCKQGMSTHQKQNNLAQPSITSQ